MDEVFGSENFASLITFSKSSPLGSDLLPSTSDYILWFAKSLHQIKFRQIFSIKKPGEIGATRYSGVELPDGTRMGIGTYDGQIEKVRLFVDSDTSAMFTTPHLALPFSFGGQSYFPNRGRQWQTTLEGMQKLSIAGRLMAQGSSLRYIRYLDDFPVNPLSNIWGDIGGIQSRNDPKIYVVQTSTTAVERCLLMTTDPGDLVLDPTCGSGTTAYVAEQWGRRWITCDTSRVSLALARTRLMAAKYPYYLMADSLEGVKKENELTNKMISEHKTEGDIKKGFVYRRVPHVTLKSIANNPEIREGMSRQEIDVAIARHADTEILFDQPYEDNKRVRVCGPFSVESLSPHRVLSTAGGNVTNTVNEQEACEQQDFSNMILENLKKSGVQNTRKNERILFDRLSPYAGMWLHASGEFIDADGKTKRVAVSIGPERGTISPQQVKEAAKEAVQGVGFDILIICGFAF